MLYMAHMAQRVDTDLPDTTRPHDHWGVDINNMHDGPLKIKQKDLYRK